MKGACRDIYLLPAMDCYPADKCKTIVCGARGGKQMSIKLVTLCVVQIPVTNVELSVKMVSG